MFRFLFIIFILFSAFVHAQDTTYYDAYSRKVKSIEEAAYYEIKIPLRNTNYDFFFYHYYMSGKLKSSVRTINSLMQGKYQDWYENGRLMTSIDYKNNKIHGQRLSYWRDGTPKRIDIAK